MAEFNSVTLAGTAFDKNATIQQVHNSAGGSFYITGGSVYYNLQYPIPQGRGKPVIWTQFEWTPDRELPTGPGEIPPGVMGIRFKNVSAATPATVTAAISDPGQPVLSVSSPSTVAANSVIPTLAYQQAVLANNVTITLANTWLNVMSVTLTSGVWLCHSRLVLTRAGGVAGFSGRIIVTGSGSGGASTESYGATAGQPFELAISTIVTIGSAGGGITTSAASTGGTATLLATIPDYPGIAVSNASELHAVQIG